MKLNGHSCEGEINTGKPCDCLRRRRIKFIQAKIVFTKATCQIYDYSHENNYC